MKTTAEDQLLRKALELGRERRYYEAIPILQQIIGNDQDQTEALLYLGRSFHAVGEYPKAIDSLRKFVEFHPLSSAGHFFLGRSYLSAGVLRSASTHLREANRLKPGFTHALILLGYTKLKMKQADEASDILGSVVETQPANETLYNGYLNSLFINGIQHFRLGNYDYTQEVFEFLLSRNFDHILLYLYLGMIYRSKGDSMEALVSYEKALLHSPEDEVILYRTAMLNMQTGNKSRGEKLLSLLEQLFPSSPLLRTSETEHALAFLYVQRGDFERALAQGLSLLKADSSDNEMRLIVAECCRELGHSDWAINHYNRVLDRDPLNLQAHFGLVLVWWELDNYHEMEKQLDRILHIEPENSSAIYYRVICRSRSDLPASIVISELRSAIDRFGEDIHLLRALGDTYLKDNMYKEGEHCYRIALDAAPDSPELLKCLIFLSDNHPLQDIETLYRRYLEIVPHDIPIARRFVQNLFSAENYHEVLSLIENILPYMKDTHWSDRIRAIAHRKIGNFQSAALLYRQLLREDPEKEEYLRPLIFCLQKSGRKNEALRMLAAALDYLKAPSAELFLIFGVIQYRKNNLEAALRAFRDAQDRSPRDWRPYFNIGEVYRKRGMQEYAERFFQQAESLQS